jgi:hypothetical protein
MAAVAHGSAVAAAGGTYASLWCYLLALPTSGAPEDVKMLGTILLVILILLLIGALPTWPHSRSWGYYPSGGLGLILIIILILLLMGRI